MGIPFDRFGWLKKKNFIGLTLNTKGLQCRERELYFRYFMKVRYHLNVFLSTKEAKKLVFARIIQKELNPKSNSSLKIVSYFYPWIASSMNSEFRSTALLD